jgi:dihydroxy-acid dehydratase
MAIARLNRPAVFVYGGTILPGCLNLPSGQTKDLDIVSVFEAVGAHANHKISDEELANVERCAIPGPGSCGGMYTANTMASAIEALGLSLPNSSAQSAVSQSKRDDARRAGEAVSPPYFKKISAPVISSHEKAFEKRHYNGDCSRGIH